MWTQYPSLRVNVSLRLTLSSYKPVLSVFYGHYAWKPISWLKDSMICIRKKEGLYPNKVDSSLSTVKWPIANATTFPGLMFYPVLFINRNKSWIVSKLVEWFPGHCPAVKSKKLTTKPFAGRSLRGLLTADPKYLLAIKFGLAQKAKYLSPFSSPLFLRFFCLIFFFSRWAFSRLHFGGKS